MKLIFLFALLFCSVKICDAQVYTFKPDFVCKDSHFGSKPVIRRADNVEPTDPARPPFIINLDAKTILDPLGMFGPETTPITDIVHITDHRILLKTKPTNKSVYKNLDYKIVLDDKGGVGSFEKIIVYTGMSYDTTYTTWLSDIKYLNYYYQSGTMKEDTALSAGSKLDEMASLINNQTLHKAINIFEMRDGYLTWTTRNGKITNTRTLTVESGKKYKTDAFDGTVLRCADKPGEYFYFYYVLTNRRLDASQSYTGMKQRFILVRTFKEGENTGLAIYPPQGL